MRDKQETNKNKQTRTKTMKVQYTQDQLVAIQIKNEIDMKTAGIERFNLNNERAVKGGTASETSWNKRIIQELVDPMAQAIDAYLEYYKGRRGKPSKTLTFLGLLPSKQSAYITIKNILDSLTRRVEARSVAKTIGSRIEDQVRFAGVQAEAPKYIEKVHLAIRQNHSQQYKHRQAKMAAAERSLVKGNEAKGIEGKDIAWSSWSEQDIVQLGSQLVTIFAENVTFEGTPVIEKKAVINGKSNKTILMPTDHIEGWINKYKEAVEDMAPMFAPCVIKPKTWTTPTNGGYHIPEIADTLPLVKCKAKQRRRLTYEQMPTVYDAINTLQDVAWQVDDKVLEVAGKVMALGLPYGMPSKEAIEFPLSPLGPEYEGLQGEELRAVMTDLEWNEFLGWKRDKAALHTLEEERKAEFLRTVRIMTGARQFQPYEQIFFVYTMDFRGRVYCKSDSVSPQGHDLQKGLIKFAHGKALGDRGYHWLAVQGANVYGEDKLTFEDRVEFIEGMEDTIRDIATDPLSFTGWAVADKPYQFLAWCFEWSSLLDWIEDGNNAEDFVSYLPVAMDGSCSGIQHYSAILRDPVGGKAVNLVPGSKPNDIYGEVAQASIRKFESLTRETDKMDEDGKPMYLPQLAQGWLDIKGGFCRSITKSPTMTVTYGSTRLRCLRTTSLYLTDLQDKENKNAMTEKREAIKVHPFAEKEGEAGAPRYMAERLGAEVIWDGIGEVVQAARIGMKYIQDVAAKVAKSGHYLEIIAPTGFICEQREMDKTSKRVKTQLMGETFMTLCTDKATYNVRKMRTSSAPNFIHLHDAAHLIMAVNGFKKAGLDSIAVIHDSFGSHACDTDTVRDILTSTLVDMYTEHDVLQDFKDVNEMAHAIEIDVEVPEEMGLDLDLIRDSEYCFG